MFDPYRKWLGIPEDARPPTHYLLLGIRADERDPDVISSAVVQRSQYVRNFQTGKYVEHATRILNEIAAAKLCLLDPAKRRSYDAELAKNQPAQEPKVAAPPATASQPPPLIDPLWQQASAVNAPWLTPMGHVYSPRRSAPVWQLAAAVGGTVVAVLAIVVFVMSRGGDQNLEESDAASEGPVSAPVTNPSDQPEQAAATTDASSAPVASTPVASTPEASILTAAAPEVDSVQALRTLEVMENSIGMKLVLIPAGEMNTGSPETEVGRLADEVQHRVRLTEDFFLGQTEVTQTHYERLMGANPSYFSQKGDGKDTVAGLDTGSFPVDGVSWQDAQEFCRRMTALAAEQAEGRRYRLPTEAEWEYACRAGKQTTFAFGDSLSSTQANFNGNLPYGGASPAQCLSRTTSVGSYGANPFNLFDMHGNVWEWCADYSAAYPNGDAVDPRGPFSGELRVLRGGSWHDPAALCRCALRVGQFETYCLNDAGFRVVMSPDRAPARDEE